MELFVGIIGCLLLYGLGQILYPDTPEHKPIQQELIKSEGDENGQ